MATPANAPVQLPPLQSPSSLQPGYPAELTTGALTYTVRVLNGSLNRIFVPLGMSTWVNLTIDCGGLYWQTNITALEPLVPGASTRGYWCEFAQQNITLAAGDVLTFKVTPAPGTGALPHFGWSDYVTENWNVVASSLEFVQMVDFGSAAQVGVRSIEGAFAGVATRNGFSVPPVVPSSLTNFAGAFYNASTFNDSTIASWNMQNAVDLSFMFAYASSFNAPLGVWDIRGVNAPGGGFVGMFFMATSFASDLRPWCVPSIPGTPVDFGTSAPLPLALYPRWGTACQSSIITPAPQAPRADDTAVWAAVAGSVGAALVLAGVAACACCCVAKRPTKDGVPETVKRRLFFSPNPPAGRLSQKSYL